MFGISEKEIAQKFKEYLKNNLKLDIEIKREINDKGSFIQKIYAKITLDNELITETIGTVEKI